MPFSYPRDDLHARAAGHTQKKGERGRRAVQLGSLSGACIVLNLNKLIRIIPLRLLGAAVEPGLGWAKWKRKLNYMG